MTDLPSNSQNPLGPKPSQIKSEKKIEKVVTGEAVQRPKSLGRRFKGLFIRGEFRTASRYVLGDVLLPAMKNTVVDAVTKGIEKLIYGDNSPRRSSSGQSRISYNSPLINQYARRPGILPDQPPYIRRQEAVADIILASREDAQLVVERLGDIIDKYEVASVADFYELVGLPSSHIDNKWGWSVLTFANVRQIREGWLIDLPPAMPIA